MKKLLFLLSLFLFACTVRTERALRSARDVYSIDGRLRDSTADFSGWPILTYRPVRMPNGEEHYFLVQPDRGDEATWIAAQRARACERAAESKAQRFFCDTVSMDLIRHGLTLEFLAEYSELLKQESKEAREQHLREEQEAFEEWRRTAAPSAIPPFGGPSMNFETVRTVWEVPSPLPLEKAYKDTLPVEAMEDAHPRDHVPITGGVRFADTKMYRWRERMQEVAGEDPDDNNNFYRLR
jgi:hypothetical protein